MSQFSCRVCDCELTGEESDVGDICLDCLAKTEGGE